MLGRGRGHANGVKKDANSAVVHLLVITVHYEARGNRTNSRMTFPVVFHIAGRAVPAHLLFELIAYAGAFQIYLYLRRRENPEFAATLSAETHVWLIAGAILGALVGAKVLAIIESFPDYWHAWRAHADPRIWIE